jgi:hypothetical protein
MKRKLEITLSEDESDDEDIVARVLELMSQGFYSGFDPHWEIVEEEEKRKKFGNFDVVPIKEVVEKVIADRYQEDPYLNLISEKLD